jgi:hypothetical protein
MAKSLASGQIVPFPNPGGEPPNPGIDKTSKAYKKAHDAFHNAKQRCTNEGHKSYPSYGGLGIKFLLTSVDQMIDLIGLPKPGLSLDRKIPHGHYEPGNIRWTNKLVQANNKKGSKGGALSIVELVKLHEAEGATAGLRQGACEAWFRILDACRRRYFTQDDLAWAEGAKLPPDLFTAGWDFDRGRDWAEPPSYFHLPSLTWPGKVVRLRGGPFFGSEPSTVFGTFAELSSIHETMVTPEFAWWTNEGLQRADKFGSAWVGQVTPMMLIAGGIEGLMLTIASRLRHRSRPDPVDAAFCPALEALQVLEELGPHWRWAEGMHPIVRARALFIPDLQIDVGGECELSALQASRFAQLLAHRRELGLRTFVGVQNANKLPGKLAREVLGYLAVQDINLSSWSPIIPATIPAPSGEIAKPRPGRSTFAEVRAVLEKSVS